jgi:hypothetical protein
LFKQLGFELLNELLCVAGPNFVDEVIDVALWRIRLLLVGDRPDVLREVRMSEDELEIRKALLQALA